MNVQVITNIKSPKCVTVPKSAVVLRQQRKVVFTLKDSVAIWNYVKTGMQNSKMVVINKGINKGDKVIVSGNLNLAHETVVEIKN